MRKVLFLFGLLLDSHIEWIARTGTQRHLATGEVLIEEGKPIDNVIILLEGQLLVSTIAFGVIAKLGAGEIVGEMSFVDSAPPNASVTAEGDCRALFLHKGLLLRKLEADTMFGSRFYRALAIFLADRLRGTVRRLGYDGKAPLDETVVAADELDEGILDNVSMAGMRFDRMLRLLREKD
jgi:CRP-like cAMP-binding protein